MQRNRRGPAANNGVFSDETQSSRMRRLQLASDLPEDERPRVLVPATGDESFQDLLRDRRNRKEKFFHHRPPRVLDVCQVPLAGRLLR